MINFITNQDKAKFNLNPELFKLGEIEELYEWKKGRSWSCFDTETNTLSYHSGDLLLQQFGDFDNQFVVDSTVEIKEDFYEDWTLVAHNALFDYNQLKRNGVVLKKVWDTMLGSQVLSTGKYDAEYIKFNHPHALDTWVRDVCGIYLTKGERATFKDLNFKESQLLYAANDVKFLDPVFKEIYRRLNEEDLLDCAVLENEYVLALGDMLYNGVYLDREEWLALEQKKIKELGLIEFKVDEALIKEIPSMERKKGNVKNIQVDMFSSEKHRPLNVNYNSHKQVADILAQLNIQVVNKKGKETTGIVDLKKIKNQTPFIEGFIELKELEKKISSFGSNWMEFIQQPTGRIHCSVNQILDTGRTATYKPNLYQVPQEKEYRACFKVQNPDWFFVSADYSAQEGRIMADKAKDADYIHFFNHGDGDPHSFVATKMFTAQYAREIRVTKASIKIEVKGDYEDLVAKFLKASKIKSKKVIEEIIDGKTFVVIDLSEKNVWRQNGKVLNFFLSFGGSAHTLANDLKIPIQEAEALVKAFFDGFPALKVMFDAEAEFALEHGYTVVNQVSKRKRFYPQWEDLKTTLGWINQQKKDLGQNFWNLVRDKNSILSKENRRVYIIKGDIERAAQNSPIQGTAADMSKTACIFLRRKILDLGLKPLKDCPIKFILMPHDEVVTEVHPDYLEIGKQILGDSMDEAGKVFVQTISLRPKVEVSKVWQK